jgi:hypothetical protein
MALRSDTTVAAAREGHTGAGAMRTALFTIDPSFLFPHVKPKLFRAIA